jgi:hypothetical protein
MEPFRRTFAWRSVKTYGREFEYKVKQQGKMPDPATQHNAYFKKLSYPEGGNGSDWQMTEGTKSK